MDYVRRRERRRLLDDLLDFEEEREEDVRRQYRSIMHNIKRRERSRSDSDDEDDYRKYRQRRKEYCLVKVIYRKANSRRRRKVDEIMVVQGDRAVFKGCLTDEDAFTFKLQLHRNESRVKLRFYINDILEEEQIGCCEHGLMDCNRPEHSFQIQKVVGAKPCYDCDFEDDTSEMASANPRRDSPRKEKIPSAKDRSLSILSEAQPYEEEPKEKKTALLLPPTTKADITDFIDDHIEVPDRSSNQHQSNEDSVDVVLPSQQSPLKRTYGPPQLSMTEAPDSPSPSFRESAFFRSLSSATSNTLRRTISEVNRNESNRSSEPTLQLTSQSSTIEPTSNEQRTSGNVAISNDETELLLARLGITRQAQVERPAVAPVVAPREKGNVEYFTLVYLHQSSPDESVVKRLRGLVNFLKVFDDDDDCIAFLNTVMNEKVILILSSSFHQSVLPRIAEVQQIFTIYILSESDDQVNLSTGKSKVQGSYHNIENIYEQMSNDIKKISRDLIIYLNASSSATSMNAVVVYSLLLSEVILDDTENKGDMKELVRFSRQEYEGNDEELQIIDEFENKYQKNEAIFWFSRSCFLSKMINKALRTPEADVLYRLRSFIQDLHHQIQDESTSESITVYLGQTIQRSDLDYLQTNLLTDDILIFPQLLFGSTDEERAIRIAKEVPLLSEEYISLIIRIDIPENFKYATLNSHRYSIDEDNNVLVNMRTMGRLVKIEKENTHENRMALIHLRLVKSEEQGNIQQILETTREQIKSSSSFFKVIKLMVQMNEASLAEQMVRTMIDDKSLESDENLQGLIAAACLIFAQLRRDRDDYQGALDFYFLSMNVLQRFSAHNAPESSIIHSGIGAMYFRLGNYEKSREFYQNALNAQLHSNTPDLYVASNLTYNIANVYSKEGKYPEAIKFYERALKILQQCSEPHDDEFAATYEGLGDAYCLQMKYDGALEYYTKAFEIYDRTIPRNSQLLAGIYHAIGNMNMKLGRSKPALKNFKGAVECYREFLPLAHSNFAFLYNNMGLMHYQEQEYPDALICYDKSLEIAAISLPGNHSMVAVVLFNIALTYEKQDRFDEAIETVEKSTTQFLKTLPPDHSDVVDNRNFVESIRKKKALKDIFSEDTISF